jgi:hypothetical protein
MVGGNAHVTIEVRRLQELRDGILRQLAGATPSQRVTLLIAQSMLTNQITAISSRLKEQEWAVIPR